jgi:hypothetical protein
MPPDPFRDTGTSVARHGAVEPSPADKPPSEEPDEQADDARHKLGDAAPAAVVELMAWQKEHSTAPEEHSALSGQAIHKKLHDDVAFVKPEGQTEEEKQRKDHEKVNADLADLWAWQAEQAAANPPPREIDWDAVRSALQEMSAEELRNALVCDVDTFGDLPDGLDGLRDTMATGPDHRAPDHTTPDTTEVGSDLSTAPTPEASEDAADDGDPDAAAPAFEASYPGDEQGPATRA